MGELGAWILPLGSFAGIVLCTAVAARSIAGDPARGRRRCPRCWHELGPTALRCAECGHQAGSDLETLRTRRRVGRAVLGMVGAIAIVLAAQSRILDRGPWALLPTRVVLALAPWSDGGGFQSATWEIARRIGSGEADDATVRAALRLFIAGDADAKPPSEAWREKYAALAGAAIARLGRGDPALDELLAIPPSFSISAIEGDGEAPLAIIDATVYWPAWAEGRLLVRFADGSERCARFEPMGRFPPLILERPAGVGRDAPVEVELECRPRGEFDLVDRAGRPTALHRARLLAEMKVEGEPVWRQALAPADSPAMRSAVAAAFDEGLVVWSDGRPRAGLRFNHRTTAGDEFEGVAVGLVVEICEDGVPRRTSRIWWRGGAGGGGARWLPTEEDVDALGRLCAGGSVPDGWTLRIRGDARLAAYAEIDGGSSVLSDATPRYFAGELERPLVVQCVASASPPRRWRTEHADRTPVPIEPSEREARLATPPGRMPD